MASQGFVVYNTSMTRGKEPEYNPEAGLPGPENRLGEKVNPEAGLSQDLKVLERQLSNVSAPGEKHSPMVMYQWLDSKANLYALPNQLVHEALLIGLIGDNPQLRHKILHVMEIEAAAKSHHIEHYPVRVLVEEILANLNK